MEEQETPNRVREEKMLPDTGKHMDKAFLLVGGSLWEQGTKSSVPLTGLLLVCAPWSLGFSGSVQHPDDQKVTMVVSCVSSSEMPGMNCDEPSWGRGLVGGVEQHVWASLGHFLTPGPIPMNKEAGVGGGA